MNRVNKRSYYQKRISNSGQDSKKSNRMRLWVKRRVDVGTVERLLCSLSLSLSLKLWKEGRIFPLPKDTKSPLWVDCLTCRADTVSAQSSGFSDSPPDNMVVMLNHLKDCAQYAEYAVTDTDKVTAAMSDFSVVMKGTH